MNKQTMPRCDIDELKEKLDIAVKALENILKDTPSCYKSKDWCPIHTADADCIVKNACFVKNATEALAKIKGDE